ALFPRIDKAKTMAEIKQQSEVRSQKSEPPAVAGGQSDIGTTTGSGQHVTEAEAVPGVASYIDIADFAKIELRVAEVKTAERIPKADKLLLLTVDVGEEKPR